MDKFKKITFYCLFVLFLMTLTSSFMISNLEKPLDLSLDSTHMASVFYNKDNAKISENDDNKESENEGTDTLDNKNEVNDEEKEVDLSSINPSGYKLGDTGEEVAKYQRLLYYLDYIQRVPDGNFGEQTKTAVEAYQKDKNLNITGIIDAATQEALLREDITFISGKEGEEIKEYQMILYYLDYLKAYPTGNFGPDTENAVLNYQKDRGISPTGNIDPETKRALKEEKLEFIAGKKGKEIMEYQRILIDLGYLHGNPDGSLGAISVAAIKEYQKNNNLEQTGNLDLPTQEALKRPLSEQVGF